MALALCTSLSFICHLGHLLHLLISIHHLDRLTSLILYLEASILWDFISHTSTCPPPHSPRRILSWAQTPPAQGYQAHPL